MILLNEIEPDDMIFCKKNIKNIFSSILFIKGEKYLIKSINSHYSDIYIYSTIIHSTVKIEIKIFNSYFDVEKLLREKKLNKICQKYS